MPTIAEILAAKKTGTPAPTAAIKTESEVKTIPEPVKEEPAVEALPKALSFAEKMALKRQQEQAGNSTNTSVATVPAGNVVSPTVVSSTEEGKTDPKMQGDKTTQASPAPAVVSSPAAPAPTPALVDITMPKQETSPSPQIKIPEGADPATAQAYLDIKGKINLLNEMADADLENGMRDLKKALMANPAAVSLMEDTDIGQMVIALRRITGEAIADAAKDKPKGRKPKDKPVDLTNPDIVQAVFDEL